jgi:hypothetical protein
VLITDAENNILLRNRRADALFSLPRTTARGAAGGGDQQPPLLLLPDPLRHRRAPPMGARAS